MCNGKYLPVVSFHKDKLMYRKLLLASSLLLVLIFQGCLKDNTLKTYTILEPVYKDKAEVYANIKSNPAVPIEKPGKIFLYGNYVFLNDVDKGVHIIDNSNPSNPVVKAFINIPGNLDIAVKGNTLYADLYTDLVVIDITNPLDAKFIKYLPDIFPSRNYSNGFVAEKDKVITGWIKKDTTIRINDMCYRCNLLYSYSGQGSSGPSVNAGPIGVSGSMARFALVNNFLYTVNNQRLTSFDLTTPLTPVQASSDQVGWNIETIFPFRDKLFIGSRTGMFIYDITNTGNPQLQGQFAHVQSCDPVIADGSYAYVTLRAGNNCGDLQSQLDVININNVNAPQLVKTYSLKNPYGLSKDGNLLFICDGTAGLKVYDAADPLNIVLKHQVNGLETYDVIALNGHLMVVAKDGLYQFSYSNNALNQLSKIPVNRN
jgi:hypothetical protein